MQDEARVGQQGTLTRVWAKRGSRPPAPRDQRRIWAYILGAACPAKREAVGVVPFSTLGLSRSTSILLVAKLRTTPTRSWFSTGPDFTSQKI